MNSTTATDLRATLRQMLQDWDAGTDVQRAEALAQAAKSAAEVARWGSIRRAADLYRSGRAVAR